MLKFKKGDVVTQAITPMTGTITGFELDRETGDVLFRVEWQHPVEGMHQRFFTESQLETAVAAG